MNDDDAPQAPSPAPATSRTARRGWWLVLSVVGLVDPLVLAFLNLAGAAGPLVTALALLVAVAGSVVSVAKLLAEQFADAPRRVRARFVAGVAAVTVLLVVTALATRTVAPLSRLRGTADVAVLGLLAPDPDEQDVYDDVADELAHSLEAGSDGAVHDYTGEADPPLEDLRTTGAPRLERWLQEFLAETDAELVVTGYAERTPAGTRNAVLVYVPGAAVSDASELSGWYVLERSTTDRNLDSGRVRRSLIAQVVAGLAGLQAFLEGLDAWQSGSPGEAVEAFGKALPERSEEPTGVLPDLVRLFRGHAREGQAATAPARDRAHLLALARADYAAIPAGSPVLPRARLSLATNTYLGTAETGCRGGSSRGPLASASTTLDALARDAGLPEMVRLKAAVNRAQVEMCRLSGGEEAAGARVDALLPPLTRVRPALGDVHAEGKRQVAALASSIEATRSAQRGDLAAAVLAMDTALALDPRFERQALWLGLQSAWLLVSCRLEEGAATQQRSLERLAEAIADHRLPAEDLPTFTAAFATDLREARERCAQDDQHR